MDTLDNQESHASAANTCCTVFPLKSQMLEGAIVFFMSCVKEAMQDDVFL